MTEIEKLIETYGYQPIESKNEYMRSYANEEKRVNYYHTSGTVTFQRFDRVGGCISIKNATAEEVETHL